jgi:6-pyruvoyltetrahydropterin/6-carboxytetrahydropterin synthase
MEIYKKFSFEAAHLLPNVPEGHKCRRLHGHSFHVTVYVDGPVDPREGWVMDFADIKKAFKPILDQLDHYYLNEIEGLENPSSENIARWIWNKLSPALPNLSRIEIAETCTSGCVYRGDDS